ncbi:DNA repair helicase XPB [Paenibacillus sp. YPG26]|uniref:DNA repair helicase XPB n=1 Tax=Paenibacillus sp. YPG26 TaxID=2878915 RepID=UPI00203C3163|nr:DNA repair helicase XPB [Paenibacillus sp. YPG26]USB34593.1 DEAD/DEAH box helicase [Paenibacillus sp. YPG26]
MDGTGACLVQRDFTVLLEKEHPGFEAARRELARFAELVKSPASFHTYRLTPLSMWNAAAQGMKAAEILDSIRDLSRSKVPDQVLKELTIWLSRYGKLRMSLSAEQPGVLVLESEYPEFIDEIMHLEPIQRLALERTAATQLSIPVRSRGIIKQDLTRLGYPVQDEAGYHSGQHLFFQLRDQLAAGEQFSLRPYQHESVSAIAGSEPGIGGGSGVLVLPCGAGKTVIGLAAMAKLQCETLILTSNVTSVRQWIGELRSKSTLSELEIGEYSGDRKEVRPVTVSTYQILSHRTKKEDGFKHMRLFNERDWGLIIYDEVHLLPAPVFRVTAEIQATRRLGLTATLVREDGCEKDVFSLIGPKLYEMPWRDLEREGWIAQVKCWEIRVPMSDSLRMKYSLAEGRQKFRLAAENPGKLEKVKELIAAHPGRQVLIIGQYLDQLRLLSDQLQAPLITGDMPQQERTGLFTAFRSGSISLLIVSKVANFAVDLPDASVGIQVSGSFGSRQEEAQRLGRLLRPKSGDNRAYFYTLVSDGSREEEFAMRRQLFLIEQGYEYLVIPTHDEGGGVRGAAQ